MLIMNSLIPSIAILIIGLIYLLSTRLIDKPISPKKRPITILVIDSVLWPIVIIVFFAVVKELIGMSTLAEPKIELNLLQSFTLHIAVAWLIARAVDTFFFRWFVFHRTGFTTPALLRGLSYALFVIAGISLFLIRTGQPITGFLISTSLAAGILGFALQNTLNDLFSGIALSIEKPFHIGEWIELEDKTVGQVIDLTWRSTRLKTFSNTQLSVPNSTMAAMAINNLNRPDGVYGIWNTIRVSSDADPKVIITILSTAVGRCSHVLQKPVPTVRLADATGAPYLYTIWVHYRSYLAHFRGQEQLYLEVHQALENAGASAVGELQEVRYARAKTVNPSNPSIVDTLQSMKIFAELNEEELEKIAETSEYILVATDTILLTEGDSSKKVHLVVNGSLESTISLSNGQRALAETFNAGDSFGWAAIVTDEKAMMTVKASSDSLVLVINGECLQPILQKHQGLQEIFVELVSKRINRHDNIRSERFAERRSLSPIDIQHRIERFIGGNNR